MNTNAEGHLARQQRVGTLIDLFAATVEEHGARPAVSDESVTLTYAELWAKTEQVASGLRAFGVGQGDRVAIHLERGVDLLVAVLAVVRTGSAYVAIDVGYPEQRRVHMVHSARATVVVTDTAAQDSPWDEKLVTTTVGDLTEATADATPVVAPVAAADPASILFTSGTTGRPKGVELTHGGLVNFATNAALPRILPTDRMGQVSSVSFDAFHYELWCAIAAGAEVVVMPSVPELLGRDPRRELKRRGITTMLMPSMAVNHLAKEDRDAFAALRVLCTGGDVILPQACREILDGQFSGEFYNLYGPTEGTTACTAHRVTADLDAAQPVPIGVPLDGCRVHLLDADLQPVPAGGTGQIFIGGAGVARGYLDEPAETAARFVDIPCGSSWGRLYATGDLGRLRPDGLLEFLGRSDQQGKIRGYRVEPFELERTLRNCPLVEDAAVLVHGEGDGKQLAAFVELAEDGAPAAVRAYLSERLPDFLVPATLIKIEQIPATANGKRDNEALREILRDDLHRRERYQKPDSRTERYLADLFEELLGVEQVGTHDDFFALGGHSLLAFRMHRRITRDFGSGLQLQDVIRHSRLADLANALDADPTGRPIRA
ncbi:non-ribosomal peptide synthetase [Micromonospora sp. NPDC049051]|uniref:non-ribosomal peptide synthetase n=1 Tax=Micromonospora sp. NPDC049051 TaxID=3364264 RepID=UPI00371AD2CD